jgi:enamine deaminase RidA (YjgF/YER057c/UK114 family)
MEFQRQAIQTKSLKWLEGTGVSPAVRAGELLLISGQISSGPKGEILHRGDVKAQARVAFEHIREIVQVAGGNVADVVDVLAMFLDIRDADDVYDVGQEFFKKDYPAWTLMGTQGFPQQGVLVQIHAVAHLGKEKKICVTPESLAWCKKNPVSGGCRKGEYLFVSGQMAVDLDGNVTNPGDHQAQSRYIFNRIREIVALAGGKLEEDVIDLLSFSVDPRSFNPMCIDVGCKEFLTMPLTQAPSWSVIGSTSLYKHLAFHTVRAICEIGNGKAVAYTPSSIFWRYLPVSGATKKEHGHLLCVAGEVSMDMDGQIVSPGDPVAQARYAFNRIKEVIGMAGGTMDNVVDIISFHKDVRAIDAIRSVSREYFQGTSPAWTAVGYPGGYFEGHLHEICARAWLP